MPIRVAGNKREDEGRVYRGERHHSLPEYRTTKGRIIIKKEEDLYE